MNKKFLTKLLNADFRLRILDSISADKFKVMKIAQYAQYVVDDVILHRNKEHENDKAWHYGFTPVNFLCAVKKNGIDRKFFEFNSVNHFLRVKDGVTAVEVVKCILVKWVSEDPSIVDFDIDKIDSMFAQLEREYAENQKAKQDKSDADVEQSESNGESV